MNCTSTPGYSTFTLIFMTQPKPPKVRCRIHYPIYESYNVNAYVSWLILTTLPNAENFCVRSITLTTNLAWRAFHFPAHSPRPKSRLSLYRRYLFGSGKPWQSRGRGHEVCESNKSLFHGRWNRGGGLEGLQPPILKWKGGSTPQNEGIVTSHRLHGNDRRSLSSGTAARSSTCSSSQVSIHDAWMPGLLLKE